MDFGSDLNFIAEVRQFEFGKELDDWLVAEITYTELLITDFVRRVAEDESITMSGLRELATLLGIENLESLISESELMRAIQIAAKHRACFRSDDAGLCDEMDCQWRIECRKLISVWCQV